MPNNPEPIDLIIAKGKKHLTKKEKEDRKERELKVPFVDVKPPSYLTRKQKKKFKEIADKLLDIGIMTELDIECLVRYILAYDLYLEYTLRLISILDDEETKDDIDLIKDIQNMQDKAFRQAQAAARELGLTITSRCKIVVPKPTEDEDDEL